MGAANNNVPNPNLPLQRDCDTYEAEASSSSSSSFQVGWEYGTPSAAITDASALCKGGAGGRLAMSRFSGPKKGYIEIEQGEGRFLFNDLIIKKNLVHIPSTNLSIVW